MNIDQNVFNILGGSLVAISSTWGVWMHIKSKRYKKFEEDDKFIDSAVKLTEVWEKLSSNLQNEITFLRSEAKNMNDKYNNLKVDFEVNKSKNNFLLEQAKLENERLNSLVDRLSNENIALREQIGTGVVKRMNG